LNSTPLILPGFFNYSPIFFANGSILAISLSSQASWKPYGGWSKTTFSGALTLRCPKYVAFDLLLIIVAKTSLTGCGTDPWVVYEKKNLRLVNKSDDKTFGSNISSKPISGRWHETKQPTPKISV
jgi:hypothetical protein